MNSMSTEGNRKQRLLAFVFLALGGLLAGCRPPQLESPEAIRIVSQLDIGVMGKRLDLVDASFKDLQKLRLEGKLSEAALAELHEIVLLARKGTWEEARRRLLQYEKGQLPLDRDPSLDAKPTDDDSS